jgi:hypothetical protein
MGFSSFPVPLDEFIDLVPIRSVHWALKEFIDTSGMPQHMITAQFADPLWTATITTSVMTDLQARLVRGYMRRIGAHGTFLLYDSSCLYPALDPDGSEIAGNNVTVSQVGNDNRSIRLSGLPGGYRLRWGDRIQVRYSSPVSYNVYEVSDVATATSGGVTNMFEVTPPLRVGIQAGNSVGIRRPSAKMQFLNYDPGISEIGFTQPMTFECIEVP